MKYVTNEKNNKHIPQATRRTLFYHCSWAVKIFQHLRNIDSCVRNFVVPMKVVVNGKNNTETLFCYCSLVVKIFQQCRRRENCVRKFIFSMKYVINGKNNFCIPQRTGLYCCLWVVKIIQQIRHLENCVKKFFSPLNKCLKSIGGSENIKLLNIK